MDSVRLRRRLAASPLAPIVAIPPRVAMVGKHNARVLAASARWLVASKEHTNLTYDLTDLNREHLAWFVASVTRTPVAAVQCYIDELRHDEALSLDPRDGSLR